MATPNQLLNKDVVNLPGIDPITEDSFKGLNPAMPGIPQGIPQPPMVPPGMPQSGQAMPSAPLQVAQDPYLPGMGPLSDEPLDPTLSPAASKDTYERFEEKTRKAYEEEIELNNETAKINAEGAAFQKGQMDLSEKEWQDGMARSRAAMDAIKESIAKGRAMGIDPDRYWNRKGTFSNILSAISVGLGSFASGMTRGATGNPGMTMLMSAIEHDIDAQKADIDNYWHSVKQELQLEDTAFNRTLANNNFRTSQRLAGIELVKLRLDEMKEKTKNPIVKRDLARFQADLELRQQGEQLKSGEYWAAIEKQRAEQELKRQQAAAAAKANLVKVAEKRNADAREIAQTLIAQGVPADEAMASALKSTDPLYPQLVGTPYASPGQAYQYYQYNAQQTVKAQQSAAKKMGKGASVADIMKRNPGMDKAQAEAQYDMLMNNPDEYAKAILSKIPGASIDPYAKASGSSSSSVIDSVTGQPVAVTNKNKSSIVTGPDGKQYLMPDDASAKAVRGISTLVNTVDEDLKVIEDIGKEYGGNISNWASMSKEDRLKYDNARYRIAQAAAKLKNPTAEPSDAVIKQNLENIPDVTSLSFGDPSVWVENYRKAVKADAYNTFNAYSGGVQAGAPKTQGGSSASTTTNQKSHSDVMDGSGWTPSAPVKQKSAPPKVDSSFDMAGWVAGGAPKPKPGKAAHSTPDKGNKRK